MKIDLNRAVEVLTACGYECHEIESLRQQVTLLRNTIEGASQIITFEGAPYYLLGIYDRDEALDATKGN